jgi:hypothetical protein
MIKFAKRILHLKLLPNIDETCWSKILFGHLKFWQKKCQDSEIECHQKEKETVVTSISIIADEKIFVLGINERKHYNVVEEIDLCLNFIVH